MNYFRTHKVIAFFLAILMILPLVPVVDLTVFAVGENTASFYEVNERRYALFNIKQYINFAIVADPTSVDDSAGSADWDSFYYLDYYDGGSDQTEAKYDFDPYFTMEIVDTYYNPTTCGIWYKVEAAPGHTAPALLQTNSWVFYDWSYYLEDTDEYADCYSSLIIMDGVNTLYDASGNVVTSVTMPQYSKPVITAVSTLTDAVSYQWQIEYEDGLWVDISGEDSATATLSYGMVVQLLDTYNSVNIRCKSTSGEKVAYSQAFPLTVEMYVTEDSDGSSSSDVAIAANSEEYAADSLAANTYPLLRYARSAVASGVMPIAEDTTTGSGTTISDPVTITIKYVLGLDDNNIVAEPFVSTIQKGTSYVYPEYELPVLEGYSAYLEYDTETIYTTYQPNIANVTEDIVITFRYWPARVNYTVIYYWQNADNDNYIEHERVVKTDFTGNITTVDDKEYDGFYQLLYETVPIASDGSTVIEVYYDRLYYLMLFRLDGGYGVQPVYARHGAKFSIPTPIKSGYSFVGWDDVNDGIPDSVVALPSAMPIKNSEYKAIWKAADTTKVTVVFWGENPNDTEYSYISSDDLIVKPGISLTYDPTNTGYVCGLENHQHGTACAVICGQDAHTHSFPNCYSLTCGQNEHSHSAANGCSLNCNYSHTHTKSCYTNAYNNSNYYVSDNDIAAIEAIGDGEPQSGYMYIIKTDSDRRYYQYLYFEGNWYRLSQDYSINTNYIDGDVLGTGTYKAGNTTYTATKYKAKASRCSDNHTHSDACYTCDKPVHSHVDACYELTCTLHIHDSSCYNCGKPEHTHSSSCKLPTSSILNNAELWEFNEEKTTEENKDVVVAADGTTVINVYYTRKTFTLTFKVGSSTVKTITEKWGAYIYDNFPIVGSNGNEYKGAEWKVPSGCKNFEPGTNVLSIDIMPPETITFTRNDQDDSAVLYYYVEALPNENDQGETYQTYNNIRYKLYKTVYLPNSGRLTESEEFHPIEGYTKGEYYPSNIFSSVSKTMYLYYTLNKYAIEFKNPIDLIKKESNVPFGTNLGSLDFTPEASFAPSKYEPGSVKFDGWYLNPECTGEEYDLSKHTMPAAVENGGTALVLYAKWVSETHEVRFYTDKEYVGTDTVYTASDGTKYIYDVPHGSKIQDPLIPPKDPTKGQYIFNGWYYIDANGNEQRWHFEETTVTRAVDVYAKWSSNTLMPYTVKFVYKDASGNEIEIADPITGSALGGNSKTFDAKANEQLYKDYQEGYFPLVQSHTIVIDLENTANNEFIFYYVKKDAVPYTVYYVTETPKEGSNLSTVELNGKTYYVLKDAVTHADNKKAIVTETYVPIAGYLPNTYQETLIINPEATEDNPNQIIFVYSIDEKHSMYIVHYYFKDVTGNNYVENMDYFFQSKAEISSTVSAAIPMIDNFTHNPNVTGTLLSGTIEKDKILELHVYYDRNIYPYKVQYLERGTLKPIMATKVVTPGSYWESLVTEEYVEIPNYTLDSDDEVTIEIHKDTADPTVNIITFWYVKDSVINYVLVKPAGATDKYCGLSITEETVKGSSGVPAGSSVLLYGTAYEFVGWFTDVNCTNSVSGGTWAGTHYVPADRTAATYYAKVVEVTVDIKYEAIGPAGASNFGTVTDDNLGVPVLTGTPSGTATPNAPTFKFVGWYDNKECTGDPISTELTYVPQKIQEYGTDKGGKTIYGHKAATYYAKFEYNLTSLTITKQTGHLINSNADFSVDNFRVESYNIDENQTFIYSVTGGGVDLKVTVHGNGDSVTIDGLTVGVKYTITELTDWSWRYSCAGAVGVGNYYKFDSALPSVTIEIGLNNEVIFYNTRDVSYWLDGDSWCDNRFMSNAFQAIN